MGLGFFRVCSKVIRVSGFLVFIFLGFENRIFFAQMLGIFFYLRNLSVSMNRLTQLRSPTVTPSSIQCGVLGFRVLGFSAYV